MTGQKRIAIYVQVRSGIGNQLFQFAFAYALARKYNCELVVCPAYYDKGLKYFIKKLLGRDVRKFHLRSIVANGFVKLEFDIDRILVNNNVAIINEQEFDESLIKTHIAQQCDIYLVGYWQNSKLFAEYGHEIRSLIKPEIRYSKAFIKLKSRMAENLVAIHIRRGDFLTNTAFGACVISYYRKAIEIVRSRISNPVFYIFSNDRSWVSGNFPAAINYQIYSSNGSGDRDVEEFYAMSLFKSLIISNSTYSWWSSYLNVNPDKLIVSPKKWFLKEAMQNDVSKLMQPEWFIIDNDLELLQDNE